MASRRAGHHGDRPHGRSLFSVGWDCARAGAVCGCMRRAQYDLPDGRIDRGRAGDAALCGGAGGRGHPAAQRAPQRDVRLRVGRPEPRVRAAAADAGRRAVSDGTGRAADDGCASARKGRAADAPGLLRHLCTDGVRGGALPRTRRTAVRGRGARRTPALAGRAAERRRAGGGPVGAERAQDAACADGGGRAARGRGRGRGAAAAHGAHGAHVQSVLPGDGHAGRCARADG